MNFNWNLRIELVKRFGSQVEAARRLGIREAKLSYIINRHAQPSKREREALENAVGKAVVGKLLNETGEETRK